jgi:hypothetical protein
MKREIGMQEYPDTMDIDGGGSSVNWDLCSSCFKPFLMTLEHEVGVEGGVIFY